jgi:hypothetical protein
MKFILLERNEPAPIWNQFIFIFYPVSSYERFSITVMSSSYHSPSFYFYVLIYIYLRAGIA